MTPAREVGRATMGGDAEAFFRVDSRWRFTEVDARAAELLDRPRDVLRGQVIWDEFPETRQTDIPEEFHRAVEESEERTFAVHHRKRETELMVRVIPEVDDHLSVAMYEYDTDDTDRLRRRASMLAATEVPTFALDGGGRFVEVSDDLVRLARRGRSELVGSHVTTLVEGGDGALQEALARGQSAGPVEVDLRTGTGDRRRCSATFSPDPASDGGTICAIRDVTSHRRAERRLAVLERVFDDDLREGAWTVLDRADEIRDRTDDPEVATAAEEITGVADDLLGIVLETDRFDGTLDPHAGRTGTYGAIDRVRDATREVRADRPDARVRLVVYDDPQMLARAPAIRAIRTLVERAVDRADGARVTVVVSAVGDQVRIEVGGDDVPGPGPERAALTGGDGARFDTDHLTAWLVRWSITGSGGDLWIREAEDRTAVVVELPRAE